jgi:Coenzyme PQQ synthesis protein D (PqqD)
VQQLADGIRSTSSPDGGTVLDITGNRIFHLNAMGDLILQCVRQGWNETRIATHISDQYSVSEERAQYDVHEFLTLLNKYRLTHTANRPEEP